MVFFHWTCGHVFSTAVPIKVTLSSIKLIMVQCNLVITSYLFCNVFKINVNVFIVNTLYDGIIKKTSPLFWVILCQIIQWSESWYLSFQSFFFLNCSKKKICALVNYTNAHSSRIVGATKVLNLFNLNILTCVCFSFFSLFARLLPALTYLDQTWHMHFSSPGNKYWHFSPSKN